MATSNNNSSQSFKNIGFNLTVKTNADVDKIDKLTTALTKLQSLTTSDFSKLANSLNSLASIGSFTRMGNSIQSLINSLNSLKSINFSGFTSKTTAVANALQPLQNITLSAQGFSDFSRGLSSLTNGLTKLKDVDVKSLSSNITSLVSALKPLTDEMLRGGTAAQSYASVLTTLKSASQTAGTDMNSMATSANKASTSTSAFTSQIVRLAASYLSVRKLASALKDAYNASANWIENLNLFAVTFGEDEYQEVLDWTMQLAQNFGFSNNELLKSISLFKQLGSAAGIAGETSTELSQTLTSLMLDLSSFYNTSINRASQVLQSSLFAGQTKPARQAFGIDVSEQTLDNLLATNETLKEMNISSRQLTQSQKTLLRSIQMLEASRNAWGDMYITTNSMANEVRILIGSIENLKLAFGDLVLANPFQTLIRYASAAVIAITNVIRAFVPAKTELDYDVGNPLESFTEGAEEADTAMRQLSFDDFEALTTSESTNEDLNVTQTITEELNRLMEEYNASISEYSSTMSEAAKIGQEWAQTIIQALKDMGFLTEDENGNLTVLTDRLKSVASGIALIASLAKGSVFGVIATVIATAAAKSEEFRAALGDIVVTLGKILVALTPIVEIIGDIVSAFSPLISWITQGISVILDFADSIGILIPAIEIFAAVLLGLKIETFTTNLKNASLALADNQIHIIACTSAIDKEKQAINELTVAMQNMSETDKIAAQTKINNSQAIITAKEKEIASLQKEQVQLEKNYKSTRNMQGAISALTAISGAAGLSSAIADTIANFNELNAAMILERGTTLALTAAYMAMGVAKAWALNPALGVFTALASGAALISGIMSGMAQIENFSKGGIPEERLAQGGSLFAMNENGKPELMYENSRRQVEISNQESLKNSFKQALMEYSQTQPQQNTQIVIEMDGVKVGKGALRGTIAGAKQIGYRFAKV